MDNICRQKVALGPLSYSDRFIDPLTGQVVNIDKNFKNEIMSDNILKATTKSLLAYINGDKS